MDVGLSSLPVERGSRRVTLPRKPPSRCWGLAEQVRALGARSSALAGLSRGLVGVTSRGDQAALIVNAPGSTGGVRDTLTVIGPMLEHIFRQLAGGGH